MRLSFYIRSIIGVFIFGTIEIVSAVAVFKFWKRHAVQINPVYKGLICAGFCIVCIIFTGLLLLSDESKPSIVVTTPLEELSEGDIANITQRIHKLKYLPFERYKEENTLSVEEKVGSVKETYKMYYNIDKNSYRIDSAVSIVIYGYESNEFANKELYFWMNNMSQKYEFVELANGINIVKGYSWMERGADTYYMAHDERIMYTYFVINNYFFELREGSYLLKNTGKSSSASIQMICNALMDG